MHRLCVATFCHANYIIVLGFNLTGNYNAVKNIVALLLHYWTLPLNGHFAGHLNCSVLYTVRDIRDPRAGYKMADFLSYLLFVSLCLFFAI